MRNNSRQQGISIGTSSLVVIFTVLCLTIFSMLSLLTANAEKALADKSAQAIKQYYEADKICSQKAGVIMEALGEGADFDRLKAMAQDMQMDMVLDGDDMIISFDQPIDDNQILCVELAVKSEKIDIVRWTIMNVEDWIPDNTLNIWDGEL